MALEQLIDLGVTRVLTSGQMASAPAGATNIRAYREHAHGRIQILPGSGIQLHNVAKFLRQTGVDQIHVSLSRTNLDPSLQARPAISFNTAPLPPENQVRRLDPAALVQMRAELNLQDEGRRKP
jgi:copper homeostasis protein